MGEGGVNGRGVRSIVLAACVCLALVVTATPAGAANRAKVRKPGPLRVLLLGDSITVGYQGTAAAKLAAKGYQVTVAGVRGSSILDVNECRGKAARLLLKAVDPDVVVFENTGNYGLLTYLGLPPCKPVLTKGSARFFAKWEKAAKVNQAALMRKGARFLWILNPTVSAAHDPPRTLIPTINAIYRRIAPPGGVIDAWSAFGGSTYNAGLHTDGLHLSAAGITKMSDLVVAAVG
jgi:lysophospholipase L1-like esterase